MLLSRGLQVAFDMHVGFLGYFVTDQGRYFDPVFRNDDLEIGFQVDLTVVDVQKARLVDIASNAVDFEGSNKTDFLGAGFLEHLLVPALYGAFEVGIGKTMGLEVVLVKMFLHQSLPENKGVDRYAGLNLTVGGIQYRRYGIASGLNIVFDDAISYKVRRTGPRHVFVLSQQFGGADAPKKKGPGQGGYGRIAHREVGIGLGEIDKKATVHGGTTC